MYACTRHAASRRSRQLAGGIGAAQTSGTDLGSNLHVDSPPSVCVVSSDDRLHGGVEDRAGTGTDDDDRSAGTTGANLGLDLHVELLSVFGYEAAHHARSFTMSMLAQMVGKPPQGRPARILVLIFMFVLLVLREGKLVAGGDVDTTTRTAGTDLGSNLHVELLSCDVGAEAQSSADELHARVDDEDATTTARTTSTDLGSNLHV